MKNVFPLILLGVTPWVAAQDCWTNTAGHAFRAKLHEVTDSHALFVMQDGTTNRLALAALDPATQRNVRRLAGMPKIPDCLMPTFNLCRSDLQRLDNLHADGRLDAQQLRAARDKILLGFKAMYQEHKLPPAEYEALKARLISGKQSVPER